MKRVVRNALIAFQGDFWSARREIRLRKARGDSVARDFVSGVHFRYTILDWNPKFNVNKIHFMKLRIYVLYSNANNTEVGGWQVYANFCQNSQVFIQNDQHSTSQLG